MFAEDIIFCQPSWVMESSTVRMAVTHLGGHMGPVQFCKDDGSSSIDPYYLSPWQCEENTVPVGQSEKVLRGDFFCLPFGYAEPEMGCPSHGKTAGGLWSLDGYQSLNGVHELRITMQNALGPAHVMRQYFLRDGEGVVYDRTTVTGLSGARTVGHHAVLRVPPVHSPLLISTSPQVFGMTYPRQFDDLDGLPLQSLAIGAEFSDLLHVPLAANGDETADLSVYPTEGESTDLVQLAVAADDGQPAWTTAVNTQEGYLWFSLRDVAVLPSTLMWIENRARQFSPWNGRSCVLGLEDVCSFFDLGSKISRGENAFSSRGIKTVHEFKADVPLVVSYIQGVTRIPRGFGRVRTVECFEGSAIFTDTLGAKVCMALEAEFVFGKEL
jgi:hypothetical protein